MRKIKITRSFEYYLNGYERKNFQTGDYEVPEDVAKYAESQGYVNVNKSGRSKETSSSGT